MARINNLSDFKSYIFRKLGAEVHTVEVTDSQFQDILDESILELHNYSDDGSIEKVLTINVNKQIDFIVDDSILAIKAIFKDSEYSNSISYQSFTTDMVWSSIKNRGASDSMEVRMIQSMQRIRLMEDLFEDEVDFDFNPETKRLSIHGSVDSIVVLALVAEPIETVLNSKLFRMLVESKCLRQWSRNIALKYDSENASIIGNGLKLNPQRMLEEAQKIEEEIENGYQNDEWSSLLPGNLSDY